VQPARTLLLVYVKINKLTESLTNKQTQLQYG